MAYVAPIVARAEAVAAKIESGYGTDSVPTASANGVRLSRRAWSSLRVGYNWPNLRDETMNQSFIPLPGAIPAGARGQLTLGWELKGLGSAYSNVAFVDADPLFQACGWAATFSSSPSNQWTYAPIGPTTARPSATVYVWAGANQYKLSGCRGNFEIMFRAGQIIDVTFTLEGLLTANPVAAAMPTETFTGAVPPPAISQSCSLGGGTWAPDYDDITFRSGNRMEWLFSGNAASGLQSYDYGLSLPEVQITARSVSQATYDPIVDWTSTTLRSFTVGFGTVQYNKGTLTDAGLYIPSDPTSEIQKGFTGWRLTYRCTSPSLLLN